MQLSHGGVSMLVGQNFASGNANKALHTEILLAAHRNHGELSVMRNNG